jgi:hypothetical protein
MRVDISLKAFISLPPREIMGNARTGKNQTGIGTTGLLNVERKRLII